MLSSPTATEFSNIIVRRPATSVSRGLRAVDIGAPDYERLCAEHDAYIAAMEAAGVKVHILPALEDYPDSVFTEDPALVFPQGAILLRPGATSRRGETAHMEAFLRGAFETVLELPPGGYAEGGDVLRTAHKVMIGTSARTNNAGARGLFSCLETLGLKSEIVQTPKDVLHFKTDCSLLDEETVFTTQRLAASGVFEGFNTLIVPEGEEAAANALRVNDVVMIGADFPRSIDLLGSLGYKVIALSTTEIGKIDAGLSCMSLRW